MEIKKFEFLNLTDSPADAAQQSPNGQAEGKTFRFFAGNLVEVEEKEFTKRDIEKNQKDAHQAGYNEGYKKAESEVTAKTLQVEQQNTQAIAGLSETLSSIETNLEQERTQFKQDVLTLARDAFNAVCGSIFDEKAADIFVNAIDEAYPIFERKGKIIIKAQANIIEKLQPKLEQSLAEKENKPEIIFEADEANANICRLEWGNSGINIDLNEKLKQIENIFNEYLKSVS